MGKRLYVCGWAFTLALLSLVSVGCKHKPRTTAEAAAPAPGPEPHREAIYFLKGDASLSPGALVKLKTWSESWGPEGAWTLACPPGPDITYGVLENRIRALRMELEKLGATQVETKLAPKEPLKPYDPVYIEWDPVKKPVYKEAFRPAWRIRPSRPVSPAAPRKKVAGARPRKAVKSGPRKAVAVPKSPAVKPKAKAAKPKPLPPNLAMMR